MGSVTREDIEKLQPITNWRCFMEKPHFKFMQRRIRGETHPLRILKHLLFGDHTPDEIRNFGGDSVLLPSETSVSLRQSSEGEASLQQTIEPETKGSDVSELQVGSEFLGQNGESVESHSPESEIPANEIGVTSPEDTSVHNANSLFQSAFVNSVNIGSYSDFLISSGNLGQWNNEQIEDSSVSQVQSLQPEFQNVSGQGGMDMESYSVPESDNTLNQNQCRQSHIGIYPIRHSSPRETLEIIASETYSCTQPSVLETVKKSSHIPRSNATVSLQYCCREDIMSDMHILSDEVWCVPLRIIGKDLNECKSVVEIGTLEANFLRRTNIVRSLEALDPNKEYFGPLHFVRYAAKNRYALYDKPVALQAFFMSLSDVDEMSHSFDSIASKCMENEIKTLIVPFMAIDGQYQNEKYIQEYTNILSALIHFKSNCRGYDLKIVVVSSLKTQFNWNKHREFTAAFAPNSFYNLWYDKFSEDRNAFGVCIGKKTFNENKDNLLSKRTPLQKGFEERKKIGKEVLKNHLRGVEPTQESCSPPPNRSPPGPVQAARVKEPRKPPTQRSPPPPPLPEKSAVRVKISVDLDDWFGRWDGPMDNAKKFFGTTHDGMCSIEGYRFIAGNIIDTKEKNDTNSRREYFQIFCKFLELECRFDTTISVRFCTDFIAYPAEYEKDENKRKIFTDKIRDEVQRSLEDGKDWLFAIVARQKSLTILTVNNIDGRIYLLDSCLYSQENHKTLSQCLIEAIEKIDKFGKQVDIYHKKKNSEGQYLIVKKIPNYDRLKMQGMCMIIDLLLQKSRKVKESGLTPTSCGAGSGAFFHFLQSNLFTDEPDSLVLSYIERFFTFSKDFYVPVSTFRFSIFIPFTDTIQQEGLPKNLSNLDSSISFAPYKNVGYTAETSRKEAESTSGVNSEKEAEPSTRKRVWEVSILIVFEYPTQL